MWCGFSRSQRAEVQHHPDSELFPGIPLGLFYNCFWWILRFCFYLVTAGVDSGEREQLKTRSVISVFSIFYTWWGGSANLFPPSDVYGNDDDVETLHFFNNSGLFQTWSISCCFLGRVFGLVCHKCWLVH